MTRSRWILIAGAGVMLAVAGIVEDLARRAIQQRYRQEVGHRQQLERQYGAAMAAHEQLTSELGQERQRSQELSTALLDVRAKMEETVGRLTEEQRTVRELQARLVVMHQRMDQLQGELATTLQGRQGGGASAAEVELDRIVVGQAGSAPLQGRVLSVHPDWNFVVVNLGWDAVKIGEILSIVHDDQLLAKARVERIQEGVCAATILSDGKIADIHVNDVARAL